MKHQVIGQRLETPNLSAFHWSPRGSLVCTGQHFVATRIFHLPKSTETSLITESDQSGPNHQLLQLCTARAVWSDSDQAVRAVHSCNGWFKSVLVHNAPYLLVCPVVFNHAQGVGDKHLPVMMTHVSHVFVYLFMSGSSLFSFISTISHSFVGGKNQTRSSVLQEQGLK